MREKKNIVGDGPWCSNSELPIAHVQYVAERCSEQAFFLCSSEWYERKNSPNWSRGTREFFRGLCFSHLTGDQVTLAHLQQMSSNSVDQAAWETGALAHVRSDTVTEASLEGYITAGKARGVPAHSRIMVVLEWALDLLRAGEEAEFLLKESQPSLQSLEQVSHRASMLSWSGLGPRARIVIEVLAVETPPRRLAVALETLAGVVARAADGREAVSTALKPLKGALYHGRALREAATKWAPEVIENVLRTLDLLPVLAPASVCSFIRGVLESPAEKKISTRPVLKKQNIATVARRGRGSVSDSDDSDSSESSSDEDEESEREDDSEESLSNVASRETLSAFAHRPRLYSCMAGCERPATESSVFCGAVCAARARSSILESLVLLLQTCVSNLSNYLGEDRAGTALSLDVIRHPYQALINSPGVAYVLRDCENMEQRAVGSGSFTAGRAQSRYKFVQIFVEGLEQF